MNPLDYALAVAFADWPWLIGIATAVIVLTTLVVNALVERSKGGDRHGS